MKIAVAAGHTAKGKGYGSVSGSFKESEIARDITKVVIKELKAKGHKVTDCTVDLASSQNAYLQGQVKLANNSGAEYFLCIHLNASATHLGKGSEIFTWNGNKDEVAVKILDNLKDLGFKNRGIKKGNAYYVIKKTNMKALLIEVFFLDNKADQKLYTKLGAEKIGKAIVNAIK
jgi:N-acetylmuramoyl-L-alanine amidase